MIILPTFGFKGTVLPVIDKTDKLYLLIENDNEHRVLLNIASINVNKFVDIKPKSSKIVLSGNFRSNLQLKIFYMGHELFDFNSDEINKEHLLIYSDYILKKETELADVCFYPTFTNGLKLDIKSNKPQILYIKIVDNDKNEILCEDNFISNEPFIFESTKFLNYGISVYNINGQEIYNYKLNLENKKVWIKLENSSIGESISWVPYVEEFRKKHKCDVFCTTYWNNLFVVEYPNIQFVGIDEVVNINALFAVYKIRCNDKDENSQKTIYDSLGLDYKEIKLNPVLEHIKKISISNTI